MANAAAERPRSEGHQSFTLWGIVKTVAVYLIAASLITTVLSSKASNADGVTKADPHTTQDAATTSRSNTLSPLAHPGQRFTIRVISSDELFPPVELVDIPFKTTIDQDAFTVRKEVNLSGLFRRNSTSDVLIQWEMLGYVFEETFTIVDFFKERKRELKHRLLGDQERNEAHIGGDADTADQQPTYTLRMIPKLTLSPIIDFTAPLPVQFREFTPVMEDQGLYGPAVYVNTFWTLKDHWQVVNASTVQSAFELEISVLPLPSWKVMLYYSYDNAMKSQVDMGISTEEDKDETKRIFLETNPYFLGLTALVTVLHVVFEYMAFSNDVKFWRGRKDFRGLSLRTIAVNCYSQTIIFLYLLDGNETSWTILIPSGLGVLMEYWKLTKTTHLVKIHSSDDGKTKENNGSAKAEAKKGRQALSLFGYAIQFNDSYDKRTRKHDDAALKYIAYALVPILAAYSVYSLVYNTHKSWYSFCIHTQVQFIYFFGFLMMTPQIFINYKMKSVGQLPWRTFIYKSLNTVIDDLFAFIIKMPWLHRIACFRDDVIFVILLYQRWIYPVDMNRLADDVEGGEDSSVDDLNEKKNQ